MHVVYFCVCCTASLGFRLLLYFPIVGFWVGLFLLRGPLWGNSKEGAFPFLCHGWPGWWAVHILISPISRFMCLVGSPAGGWLGVATSTAAYSFIMIPYMNCTSDAVLSNQLDNQFIQLHQVMSGSPLTNLKVSVIVF